MVAIPLTVHVCCVFVDIFGVHIVHICPLVCLGLAIV